MACQATWPCRRWLAAALLVAAASSLAPTRRQVLAKAAAAAAVGAPAVASANLGGANSNSLNLRISDKITAPEARAAPEIVLPTESREALAASANDFAKVGAAFAEEDGGGASAVQKFFAPGGDYDQLQREVQAVSGDGTVPKGVRKAGKAFLEATSMSRASYNTGAFDKAAEQYDFALSILVGFLGRVGVVADVPPAPKSSAPVTRRTYLPAPFQLL